MSPWRATAATCLAVACVTGCTSTVGGTALPAATLGHAPTTTTAPSSSHVVSATELEGLLLTSQQVVDLVGGTNVASVLTIVNTADASTIIDDRTCVGIGSIADASVYSNSGWVAMRGNQFSSPGVVQADVTQVVTSFASGADTAALLQRARQAWDTCAHRRYSFHSSNGNHSFMDTGAVTGGGSRITVLLRQEEDPRWACTHAMAVQNTVLTEARVCLLSRDTTAAVNKLLDQVIARVPQ
ncbi:hypothetical protein BST27_12210 [Mycobacterium intermedium]|uniref:PknH-like extracellular domain-containing protein n=1 Tax=Mycobacterium intermedium TaxID=28445 RepID=A0A1E3SET7_MYCIE|nr:sensor domain-containing protein [Mycobacterium intermedium]MCV6965495.1 sensor domain-containing protein [Mycobacterium intermedium]ODR00582.1 hypothetical protein BHQ20_12505 [Mycobacterium intermedium]OPE51545.1 hypothetical protein BV508_06355 [Mycobacterium intermedium]ORB05730.1 hypothetical protein BST27_12210 [Mycobacterium intermedium]